MPAAFHEARHLEIKAQLNLGSRVQQAWTRVRIEGQSWWKGGAVPGVSTPEALAFLFCATNPVHSESKVLG